MKTKVFHIISHFDIGGAEKVAFNIAKSHNPDIEYHIVEVIRGTSEFSEKFIQEAEINNIPIHRSKIRNTKLAIILFPIKFLLLYLKFKPKVIHTHTEVPDISIYLFFKLFRCINKPKLVRTIHNNILWNRWKNIGLHIENFFQKYGQIIAISESTQASYLKEYKLECPIIYNGVSLPNNKIFNQIETNKVNILFAGRLEYQKGISTLGQIIHELNINKRFFFHIVGTGSLKSELLKYLEHNNNYRYYEKIYNLADFINNFDYLIIPSVFEGLALIPIEASLAKIPSIINACLGLEETMPKDWPLKVHNNDINEYINIFDNIDKFDYKKLQNLAYNNAIQKFSIKSMQEAYENTYLHEIHR